ncbi:MAG: hypothetical protein QME59_05475, partial [Candidatus Hydrothermarchaeota archaeon]|nr:hypothetical protein [Candidatus Hydrothermarchaeota archaeon]
LGESFFVTAIVVKEKTDEIVLDEVCDLAREYCDKAGIKQPAAWDAMIDFFKMLGWIDVRVSKIKFLLPKSKLREVKREIARGSEIKGKEILRAEKEKIRKAVIDF